MPDATNSTAGQAAQDTLSPEHFNRFLMPRLRTVQDLLKLSIAANRIHHGSEAICGYRSSRINCLAQQTDRPAVSLR